MNTDREKRTVNIRRQAVGYRNQIKTLQFNHTMKNMLNVFHTNSLRWTMNNNTDTF